MAQLRLSPAENSFYQYVLDRGVDAHKALADHHSGRAPGAGGSEPAASGEQQEEQAVAEEAAPPAPDSDQQHPAAEEEDVVIIGEKRAGGRRGGRRAKAKGRPSLAQLHKWVAWLSASWCSSFQ